jgi:Protein of unknown function (DUF3106)
MKPLAHPLHNWPTPAAAPASRPPAPVLASFAALVALMATTSLLAANMPGIATQAAIPATIASPGAKAQIPPAVASPAAHVASSPAVATDEAKPLWKDLTPDQQQSLRPLATNWPTISEAQKRKWLALSRNFPGKTPIEQAKLHSRMTEWVSLSQQQRTQARLNFAEAKTLSPAEKAARWKAYQALSPEEKQKLAAKNTPAPAGATSAVKPVPEQKLAKVPTTRHSQATGAVAANSPKVDANTLLPLSPSAGASVDGSVVHRN